MSAEMREIDRLTTERFNTPSELLMEEAASASLHALAAEFQGTLSGKRARVLCGRGNNGGDGAALARKLWLAGARTDLVLFGSVEETSGEARKNFEVASALSRFDAGSQTLPSPLGFVECQTLADWEELAGASHDYDIIVDAMFGTGLSRPLEGLFLKVVEHLALLRRARERAGAASPFLLSLDVPSGVNADSAQLIGDAVQADLTVAFTAAKPANVLPPASHHCGKVVIAAIGSPPALLEASQSKLFLTEESEARRWLMATRYGPDSHKYSHGHVLIIAGSRGMTGAAALCGKAAMRSGAGMVTVATATSAEPILAGRAAPEIMTKGLAETTGGAVSLEAMDQAARISERATVVAIGPGLSSSDESTRRFVRAFIEQRTTPVVIDADGLNALSPWREDLRGSARFPLILTPHPGEMRRLRRDDSPIVDSVEVARSFATSHGVIVVLKGSRTLVAAPDGRVFINPTGNAGLGTAGAGDTLTGIIAGFLAQAYQGPHADPIEATVAAVYVGGLAGDFAARDRGVRSLIASDITESLGAAMISLDPAGERQ